MNLTGIAVAAALCTTGASKPMHYALKASVSPASSALSVELAIDIPAEETRAPVRLVLGRGYRIIKADAGPNAAVAIEVTDLPWKGLQSVTVTPRRPGRLPVRLRLAYAGELGPSGEPPLNMITRDLVELNLDSMWAPIRADLGGRFTLEAEIRGVPADLVVVAPGQVSRRGDTVILRRTSGDLDVAFAAMRGLRLARADGFEFYAADLEGERARIYRRRGAEALTFLERWFGPMPGRPARVVMVRRERVSGYARPGYVVVTETPSTGGEQGSAKFIAHEFAHAWWSSGDSTGEDRWLSESIAEYVALRYVEAAFGAPAREEMLTDKRAKALEAGPVLGRGLRGDPVLYNKGPVLLFDLETRIGRERMDRLLAGLAKSPPDTTASFLSALARLAGPAAATDFEAALRI